MLYVKDGRVFDFLTNDRCAAGTGRYLENMARFLKMPLTEFAAAWAGPGGHLPDLRHLRGKRTGGPSPGRGRPGPHRRRGQRLGGPAGPGHGAPLPLPHPGVCRGRGPQPGRGPVPPGSQEISGCWCRPIPNSTAPWAAAWRRPAGLAPGAAVTRLAPQRPPGPGPRAAAGTRAGSPAPGRGGGPGTAAVFPPGLPLHLPRQRRRRGGQILLRLSAATLRRTRAWSRNMTTISGLPDLGLTEGVAWIPRLLGRWPDLRLGLLLEAVPGPDLDRLMRGACVHGNLAPLCPGPGKPGALLAFFHSRPVPETAVSGRASPGLPGQTDGCNCGGRACFTREDEAGPDLGEGRLGSQAGADFPTGRCWCTATPPPPIFSSPTRRGREGGGPGPGAPAGRRPPLGPVLGGRRTQARLGLAHRQCGRAEAAIGHFFAAYLAAAAL